MNRNLNKKNRRRNRAKGSQRPKPSVLLLVNLRPQEVRSLSAQGWKMRMILWVWMRIK